MLSSALLFLLSSPMLWVSTTYAPSTNVTCPSQDAWMTNSMGQNPCLVIAWLWVPCYGTDIEVDTIHAGFQYIGPSKSDSTAMLCQCNTVVYSLLAACGICQSAGIQPWPIYSINCMSISNGSYPEPIPGGTAVPAWAYVDVIRNSTFDVDTAKAIAAQGLPDTTSGGSSVFPTPTSSTTSMSGNGSHSSSNVGAIVGGVIGAVIGLLLVGVLALHVIRRHRRRGLGGQNQNLSSQTPAVHELSGFGTPGYRVPTLNNFPENTSRPRVYDPDDPRTYPTDPSRTHPGLLPARGGTGSMGYNGHP